MGRSVLWADPSDTTLWNSRSLNSQLSKLQGTGSTTVKIIKKQMCSVCTDSASCPSLHIWLIRVCWLTLVKERERECVCACFPAYMRATVCVYVFVGMHVRACPHTHAHTYNIYRHTNTHSGTHVHRKTHTFTYAWNLGLKDRMWLPKWQELFLMVTYKTHLHSRQK